MVRETKVALPAATKLSATAGLVGLEVEDLEGLTWISVTVAIPLSREEAHALADRLRSGGSDRPAGADGSIGRRPSRRRKRVG